MLPKSYIFCFLIYATFIDFHSATAQNINTPERFPDLNFRMVVEQFMEVPAGGAFSAQDAAAKTGMLDSTFSDIQDMKGIEYFTGITELFCYFNSLTSLDLSKNVMLEWVDCSFNDLETLILPPLSSIRILDCSFNQLENIANLESQSFLGMGGYVDVRSNNLTCDDWDTILFLQENIGEAVIKHDPEYDLDFLITGFAFAPQNDTDLTECQSNPPTQPPTATPTPIWTNTPSPTPIARWTSTPSLAMTPTPIPCLKEPTLYEFSQSGLAANGWAEIPGGFIPNTSSGSFSFRAFSTQEYPESQDGKGLAVSVQPGQVTFLYTLDAIRTGDSPVLLRLHFRASSPAAQVVLAALKGNTGQWDGSLGIMSPNNAKQAVNGEFQEVLLYQPDDEGIITPVIQVVGLTSGNFTTVLIDRLEVLPVNHPLFSSTGIHCESALMRIPDPVPFYRNDFGAESLEQSGWSEIPGGFTSRDKGMVHCGSFPNDYFISSQDQKGITITVQSGQVEFLYLTPALDTHGYPLLLKMNVRADSSDVSITLGALKGDFVTKQYVDGSIAYQTPVDANAFLGQERQIIILYEPDEGIFVTPFIQTAATVNAGDVHVLIDSIEISILDKTIFSCHPPVETEPTHTHTPTYTHTSTMTPTATDTPIPTNPPVASPTPMMPVVIDGAAGGTITLPDRASVEIPTGFTFGEANIALNKMAESSDQMTNEYAVMSGEYELSIETEGDFNSGLVLALPVVNNEWRDSLDLSLAGVQYFDEAEGAWKSLGALAEFDPATNLLLFRLALPPNDGDTVLGKVSNFLSAKTYQEDPVFLGRSFKRKFRVYIPFFGRMFITSREGSNFKIHYYPQSVKKDAVWSTAGSGTFVDTLVPDYIEDLDKAMNEALSGLLALKRDDGSHVFQDPTAGLIGKNTLDVYVRDLGTADGNSAPRGWLSGRIQIHETRLENWQTMRGTAAHELCHYLQGDYYSLGGKPTAWFFGNLWFFEATANYYSAVAMNMDAAEKHAYWSGTMAKYLSVPITANEEASYYTLSHFLDWLEHEKFPGESIVADVMNQRFYNTDDRLNLQSAIRRHSSASLSDVFREYGEFIITHPDNTDTAGLNKEIKNSLSADVLQYLTPKEALSCTFIQSTKTGKPALYFVMKRQLNSLSMAYLKLQAKTTEDGLLVGRYDQCQGEGLAVTSTLTYVPAGTDDSWYDRNDSLEKSWVFTNPLSVKNFGGTAGINSFEQAFINRGFANGSQMAANLHCQYYLLLKPEIIEIQDGAVLWSTRTIGNIPLELIAGYDVYRLDNPQAAQGVKLNPTSIPYTALQQSYVNEAIKKTDSLVIVVRDTLGNRWPEISTTNVVIDRIPCKSAPVGAMVSLSGKGFGNSRGTSRVLFGGQEATNITLWSDTSISLQIPAGAKTGNVIVTVNGENSNTYAYEIDENFSAKVMQWKDNISVMVTYYPIVDYAVVVSSELIQNTAGGKIEWINPAPGIISGLADMDYYTRNSQGEEFKYKTVSIRFEEIPLALWCHCITYDSFFDFESISECDNPTLIRFWTGGVNPNNVGIEIKTYDENGNQTGSYDSTQGKNRIELRVTFSAK